MEMRRSDAAGPVVQGFAGTGFRVDGVTYPALLLTVTEARAWSPPPFADLTEADFAELLADAPEFVILGTGATLVRPPKPLRDAFAARGLGLEAMDSRAAARAWGVLRAEGRRIAAALYPLGGTSRLRWSYSAVVLASQV